MKNYNISFFFNRFLISTNLLKNLLILPDFSSYINLYIEGNIDLNDYNKIEIDWKNLCKTMINPKIRHDLKNTYFQLSKLNHLIFKTNNYKKIVEKNLTKSAKILGTVYSIAFFPNIVCNNEVIYKDQLIKLSKQIVIQINKIQNQHKIKKDLKKLNVNSLVRLSIIIREYINIFNLWQKKDKEYLIYNLAKNYILNEIKMIAPLSSDTNKNEIYLNAFKQEQKSLKEEVKFLRDHECTLLFNELISCNENYNKIEKYFYWNNVKASLYKNPPDKTVISTLFKETKRLIKNLVLKRKDLLDEIDDVIDEEIITNVLNEGEIDEQFYYRKCEFILLNLQKLQAHSEDKKLEEFKISFMNKIEQRMYFKDLIPFFFRYVLDSLEKIHEQKNAFFEHLNEINKNEKDNKKGYFEN